jgi:APA family basic amino acid/polyamine antiporter
MTAPPKDISANRPDSGDPAPRGYEEADATPLRRALSLPLLILYGLGTIIGAGIYVLVGKVAGVAGIYAPVAFAVAAVAAFVTALTYAELAARYPKSAGEPIYVARGLGVRGLSIGVGLMIVLSGLVSSATIANGFVGYLHEFVAVPRWLAIVLLLGALGALAIWGIAESVVVATLSTLAEIAGLVIVIAVCRDSLGELPQRLPELVPPPDTATWQAILLGAFLAFYAFIGFEDMVNVAEEARNPVKDMPRAILAAALLASVLYVLVALAAVLSLPAAELAASDAPLALLYQRATGDSAVVVSLIGLFAVVNGALIQIIMAARVLYGMSREGWLPPLLGQVWQRTRTPVVATVMVTAAVLLLALVLPLVDLAKATSFVVLSVFILVNAALLRLKLRRIAAPARIWQCPLWVPAAGMALSALLLVVQMVSWS